MSVSAIILLELLFLFLKITILKIEDSANKLISSKTQRRLSSKATKMIIIIELKI